MREIQTQIKLQKLFQQTTVYTTDKFQTKLHYKTAKIIAKYTDYRKGAI